MQLAEVVRTYVQAKNLERPLGRELAAKTVEHLAECALVYSRHLGRPAEIADLAPLSVNAFLLSMLEAGASPYTVKNRRTGLRALWRFAHESGLAPPWSGVRTIHCPPLSVDGYSLAKMQRFLLYVGTLRGVVRLTGIPRALWWASFLRTDWEVGLRVGDMLRIELEHFDATGWLWTRESKTGKAGWRRLRADTAESVAACLVACPGRKRIWPGYTSKNICRAFKELAKRAGVGGTSKFIRRGGSSESERLFPGSGWKFLRHSGPQVWEKHYRVDRIVEQDAPGPPEIPKPPLT